VSWTSAQRWVLGLTALASLLVVLDTLVVTAALSAIRLDLGASVGQLEWTVNAYVLSFAVLLLPAAALGDRFGRRRLLVGGLGVFAAASAGCALASSVSWLIVARAVQGAGAALVMPLALTLLGAAFPGPTRGKALGIYAGVSGLAVALGPLLGGAVVEGISWPWIFWLNVPLALLVAVLSLARTEESVGERSPLDPLGLVLVTGAALGIVWGLVRGNSVGWDSREVVSTLTAGALLTLAFVAWELRTRTPMLPLQLFRSRAFSGGNAAAFFTWGSALGALFFMAQFFQTGLGYGPLGAGLRLMPWGATTFVVPQLAGRMMGRFGARPFMAGGLALHAAAMGWIALIARPELAYWQIVAPLIISGVGVAMATPTTQSAILSSVGPQQIGKASGSYSTLRQLGGAFGVAIIVAVFAGFGSYASAKTFSDGFAAALTACAALSLAGAGAAMLVPGVRSQRAAHAAPLAAGGQSEATKPPVDAEPNRAPA
jgi:EmrB/QacA subfamily drug resistance transporter